MTAVDELSGPPSIVRACVCQRAEHRHGTRAAYVADRCRCRACREANRIRAAARSRGLAYGRWEAYVDAEPARAHVRMLMESGLGHRSVAARAGLSDSVVTALLYGKRGRSPSRRIRQATADSLLAVAPGHLAAGSRIDATGTRRRLEGLVVAGWSMSEIGRRIGVTAQNIHAPFTADTVLVRTAATVRRVYDEIAFTTPPDATARQRAAATRARRHAKTKGWRPPGAWLDRDIDDPNTQPEPAADPRHDNRRRRRVELLEDVEWLARTDTSLAEASQRLAMSPDALERALYRAHRPDLIASLKPGEQNVTPRSADPRNADQPMDGATS